MGLWHVRPATVDDATAIGTIHVEAWRAAYRGLLPDDLLDGLSVEQRVTSWRRSLTKASEGAPRPVVIEVDHSVAGFAVAGPSRDEDAPPSTMELSALYLAPHLVGHGYGAPLLREALAPLAARGASAVTLWVLEENQRARRFYEREGFTPDGGAKVDARLRARELRYRRAFPTRG